MSKVAEELGLPSENVVPYGRDKAKIELHAMREPRGKLVLVSAITPTPAGEGKTTTSIGLTMGLCRTGTRAVVCLREPSLGPVFGIKGGGTGGGRATIEPDDEINLHFTGDIHAIGSAHNLLSALIDNELYFRSPVGLDGRRVTWPRVMDMNDRALRSLVVGLRGDGAPRETRFDITAASEVMATLCLASSLDDLRARLGRIVIGARDGTSYVTAAELGAPEAMSALLLRALEPNLVQTAEGGPAIVHGGPFANIAHGCSSVIGTRMGLGYADVVVTEAGFGFDLGGQKFFDIKCRSAGLWPDLVVLVATLRALKMHGGAPLQSASAPSPGALEAGLANLEAHLDAVERFGVQAVVAINRFGDDPEDELALLAAWCEKRGVRVAPCDGFAQGGEGALELARAVKASLAEDRPREPRELYPIGASFVEKIETIATQIYGADGVVIDPAARRDLERFEAAGYRELPVCMAKTFRSISDDMSLLGRPKGFTVTVREVRLSAGAGFVVALLGDVMTMPGLPKRPAAHDVRIASDGTIRGLMRSE
jgi:formate--tetrahydrofolate ligase